MRVHRRGTERTHKGLGVLLQNLTVDVIDRVAGKVIAGIVGAAGRAARPHRHRPARAPRT